MNVVKSVSRLSLALLIMIPSLLAIPGCSTEAPQTPRYWLELVADEQWRQNLTQWLTLSYIEEQDIAGFSMLDTTSLAPSLYSTYAVVMILNTLGEGIEDGDRIADWVDSLKNEEGFYFDENSVGQLASRQTNMAITILTALNRSPKDAESTVDYLLSLQDEDGLFHVTHDNPELDEALTGTREGRINWSIWAVDSLLKLGQGEEALQKTRELLAEEIATMLPVGKPFPELSDMEQSGTILSAILTLAQIDSSLVPARARDFISESLGQIPAMPADILRGIRHINKLLAAAELLELAELEEDRIHEEIKSYLETKIFPLQNLHGGFGPMDNNTEPSTTYEVVCMTQRLDLPYPNLQELLTDIGNHQVDDGWANFVVLNLEHKSQSTFYALQIAEAINFTDYDQSKIATYLNEELLDDSSTIKDIYYAAASLAILQGSLSQSEHQAAETACLRLSSQLPAKSGTNFELEDLYEYGHFVLAREVIGFDMSEDLEKKITEAAKQAKTAILEGRLLEGPVSLYFLWVVQEYDNITDKSEVQESLEPFFTEYGGYLLAEEATLLSMGFPPEYVVPDMLATFYAQESLSRIGAGFSDESHVLDFVMASKHRYGFDYASLQLIGDRSSPDFRSTYAALMLLKEFSE